MWVYQREHTFFVHPGIWWTDRGLGVLDCTANYDCYQPSLGNCIEFGSESSTRDSPSTFVPAFCNRPPSSNSMHWAGAVISNCRKRITEPREERVVVAHASPRPGGEFLVSHSTTGAEGEMPGWRCAQPAFSVAAPKKPTLHQHPNAQSSVARLHRTLFLKAQIRQEPTVPTTAPGLNEATEACEPKPGPTEVWVMDGDIQIVKGPTKPLDLGEQPPSEPTTRYAEGATTGASEPIRYKKITFVRGNFLVADPAESQCIRTLNKQPAEETQVLPSCPFPFHAKPGDLPTSPGPAHVTAHTSAPLAREHFGNDPIAGEAGDELDPTRRKRSPHAHTLFRPCWVTSNRTRPPPFW